MPPDLRSVGPDGPLELAHRGRRAVVQRSERHPEEYLYIDVDGRHYFLGVLEKGMTRGDVKRMALEFLERDR